MRNSFNKTKLKRLKNIGMGSRQVRVSMITCYRTTNNSPDQIRRLATLAAHNISTQERSYNFSLRNKEMVDTVLELQKLRIETTEEKVQNWIT